MAQLARRGRARGTRSCGLVDARGPRIAVAGLGAVYSGRIKVVCGSPRLGCQSARAGPAEGYCAGTVPSTAYVEKPRNPEIVRSGDALGDG